MPSGSDNNLGIVPGQTFSLIEPRTTGSDNIPEAATLNGQGSSSGLADDDNVSRVKSVEYYVDHVTFLVENTLFKIPRYGFITDSGTAFSAMFSLPEQTDAEGMSDEKPIVLSGVTALEFTRFLRVLYPRKFKSNTFTKIPSCDEWSSVLRLAELWQFDDIRSEAIAQMSRLVDGLPIVEKIRLAHQYGVESWFIEGLNELVVRVPSISDSEGSALGLGWSLRLSREREACLGHVDNHPHGGVHIAEARRGGIHTTQFHATPFQVGAIRDPAHRISREIRCSQSHEAALRKAFGEELKEIQYKHAAPARSGTA